MGGNGSGINREKERLDKINEIWELTRQHPKWSKEKVMAVFQLKYGTSRRTVLDYLRILEKADKITWNKD